ncbi:TetR/AcrR family transcriptional regulator [Saccharothrix sp. Mg75]|uniref:TetR/AcrR family transcriptional regulator n=1 Tax=Saccharothrix sp. Mg75 TaxID=3445357 RepID=UPI003EEC2261
MARRTRDDWTAVALEALAAGGVAAVAVEPLAARLGATKGSAYWHFADREDLLGATLERWERDYAEAVLAPVAAAGPEDGLRLLLTAALERPADTAVEVAMLAARDAPAVAPVLRRVTERRAACLEALFRALGFPPDAARRRAVLACSVYLGQAHLASSGQVDAAAVDEALAAVVGRA